MPFADPEKRREYHRRYNHKPERKAYREQWYEDHKEEVKEAVRVSRHEAAEQDALAQVQQLLGPKGSGRKN